MTKALQRQGLQVNHKHVLRIMREQSLLKGTRLDSRCEPWLPTAVPKRLSRKKWEGEMGDGRIEMSWRKCVQSQGFSSIMLKCRIELADVV